MKKKLLAFLLVALSLTACIAAFSACGVKEGGFTFEPNDNGNGYKLVHYDKTSGDDVEIPSVVKGKPVTAIGKGAFADCRSLKSIGMPITITSIEDRAFIYCESLTTVAIPASVTSIGKNVFEDCTSLKNIIIPGSVTNISEYAFRGCSSLTNVIIGGGVRNIDRCAFENCTSLTSITIPDSITSIGGGAFNGCDKLIQNDGGVCYVDKWIVGTYITYTSYTELRNNTVGIASGVFSSYVLEDIIIPDSVKSIGRGAFDGCGNLTSITIPDSVTTIGEYAFRDCDVLTIYCEAASQPSSWDSDWNFSNRPVVWDCKNKED